MTKQDLTEASGVIEWAEFEASNLAKGCRCASCWEFDYETAEYIAKCVQFYKDNTVDPACFPKLLKAIEEAPVVEESQLEEPPHWTEK